MRDRDRSGTAGLRRDAASTGPRRSGRSVLRSRSSPSERSSSKEWPRATSSSSSTASPLAQSSTHSPERHDGARCRCSTTPTIWSSSRRPPNRSRGNPSDACANGRKSSSAGGARSPRATAFSSARSLSLRAAGALNPASQSSRTSSRAQWWRPPTPQPASRMPYRDALTIGYFSGTASHDIDFLEAAARFSTRSPPLRGAAARRRAARVGWRSLLAPVAGSSASSAAPFDELPEVCRVADVALAPLELGNRFAGRRGRQVPRGCSRRRPAVASRSEEFARVIEDGRNGHSGRSARVAREALRARGLRRARRAVGGRAHVDVRARHMISATVEAQASALAALAGPLPQRPCGGGVRARPAIGCRGGRGDETVG